MDKWLDTVRVEGDLVYWRDKSGCSRFSKLAEIKVWSVNNDDSWKQLYEVAMKIVNKTDGESVELSSMRCGQWYRDNNKYFMVAYCDLPLSEALVVSSDGYACLRSVGDRVQKVEAELHIGH